MLDTEKNGLGDSQIDTSLGYDDSKEPNIPVNKAAMMSKGLIFAIILAVIAIYIAVTNLDLNGSDNSYQAQLNRLEEKTGVEVK